MSEPGIDESSVDRSPNFATPLSADPINHETDGDIAMNTIQADQTATFAEFLETEAAQNFLYSAESDLEVNAADILNNGGVDWALDLISDHGSEDDALYAIEEAATGLVGAAYELRRLIATRLEQTGAIDRASKAVEAFVSAPTEANRLELVQVSEVLRYHDIPMPRALKGKLRPYVTKRSLQGRINFGTVFAIAEYYLATKDAPKQEAISAIVERDGSYFVTLTVPADLVEIYKVKTLIQSFKDDDAAHAQERAKRILDCWLGSFKESYDKAAA